MRKVHFFFREGTGVRRTSLGRVYKMRRTVSGNITLVL